MMMMKRKNNDEEVEVVENLKANTFFISDNRNK
jgi:hypothetical protein